jgi:hypothetical protein
MDDMVSIRYLSSERPGIWRFYVGVFEDVVTQWMKLWRSSGTLQLSPSKNIQVLQADLLGGGDVIGKDSEPRVRYHKTIHSSWDKSKDAAADHSVVYGSLGAREITDEDEAFFESSAVQAVEIGNMETEQGSPTEPSLVSDADAPPEKKKRTAKKPKVAVTESDVAPEEVFG